MFRLLELVQGFRKDLFLMWSIITGVLAFLGLLGLMGWGAITLMIVTSFVWVHIARNMLSDVEEALDYVKETEETSTKEGEH